MLFNSYEFILLFLPIVIVLYYSLHKINYILAKIVLVLASLFFYGYFNKSYILIIIFSIVINYSLGLILHNLRANLNKKLVLILGIILNVGALVYFKYLDFFIENINQLFHSNIPLFKILLPLGISFFTFQQLSFLIDTYRGKNLKYDFLSYSLFVTFFPQLIAGPIVLPSEMLPQFENKESMFLNYDNLNKGLFLFSIGLVKKIVIADSLALLSNTGFNVLEQLNFIDGWITSLSYTMQIYFDFSGYCDMASGVALMFNIILPINFNSPYRSVNIQDFWKRWHITLSRFFTTYVYIPLGGNRKSEVKTLRNLVIVFLVSGLWHGASWTFILWGGLHGISILIHRVWKNTGSKLNKFIGMFLTFNLVNIFWIFFRAESIDRAFKVLKSLFDFSSVGVKYSKEFYYATFPYFGIYITLAILGLSILISVFYKSNSFDMVYKHKFTKKYLVISSIFFAVSISLLIRVSDFLYFNF